MPRAAADINKKGKAEIPGPELFSKGKAELNCSYGVQELLSDKSVGRARSSTPMSDVGIQGMCCVLPSMAQFMVRINYKVPFLQLRRRTALVAECVG